MVQRMKQYSVVKKVGQLLWVMLLLVLLVFAAFTAFCVSSVTGSLSQELSGTVHICGRGLDDKLKSMDMLLERLIYKNNNYSLLHSDDHRTRYFAALDLRKLLSEAVSNDIHVDFAVIAESEYGTVLDCNNLGLPLYRKQALHEVAMAHAERGSARATWQVGYVGDGIYVYKFYLLDNTAVGLFASAEHFMDLAADLAGKGRTLLLTDPDGLVWAACGAGAEGQSIGQPIQPLRDFLREDARFQMENANFSIVGYSSRHEIFSQLRQSLLAVAAILVILLAFTIVMNRSIRRDVLDPVRAIQRDMEHIGAEGEQRIREDYPSEEFAALSGAVNRMTDDLMALRIEHYEKQLQLQDAELRAFKLQIRSRFFLNAMNTISSLSQQGRNAQIQTYTRALSRNIRYIFHSGLHTVPLADELTHVENYFELQELKYPGCVLYSIEMMPGTEEWLVPQMLVHTVIENTYSYAVSVNRVLTILIRAELISAPEPMLRITVEDNGKGYPEEMLANFADPDWEPEDGKHIGLWSLRRMLWLMYDRQGLFRVENIIPHGCRHTILLPPKPLNEIAELPQVRLE